MNNPINSEWYNFINSIDDIQESDVKILNNTNSNNYFQNHNPLDNNFPISNDHISNNSISNDPKHSDPICNIPKCSDIYISTKTKISFLNQPIELKDLFWKIPIIKYYEQKEGIIKKQIKIQSFNKEDLDRLSTKLKEYYFYKVHIINSSDNNEKNIFRDTRKISIGINKKDIINTRCKEKSAFYNCFVIVLRVFINDLFKEFHVKIFNTGKLEIPGIKEDYELYIVLDKIINIINKLTGYNDIDYFKNKIENVLINSNFNCGYYINRERLYNILRNKYNINSCYDPCSYPGIQSQFYYNICDESYIQTGVQPTNLKENFIKISFMIFRTGSILMVGKCDEKILNVIYKYLKKILLDEYHLINTENIDINTLKIDKKKKIKKRTIYLEE